MFFQDEMNVYYERPVMVRLLSTALQKLTDDTRAAGGDICDISSSRLKAAVQDVMLDKKLLPSVRESYDEICNILKTELKF